MLGRSIHIGMVLLLALSWLLAGCGSDDDDAVNPPANHAPQIASITATPSALGVNSTSTVNCIASDPDETDSLAYYWTADYGTFVSSNALSSVTWKAPSDVMGPMYLYVRVWDGDVSVDTSVMVTVINQSPTAPTNPSPAPEAEDVSIQPTLSWSGVDPDGDTLTFDVYFGETLIPVKIDSELTTPSYSFPDTITLEYETEYFWKVVAQDPSGRSAESELWSFTTAAEGNQPPSAPSNPSPADGAQNTQVRPTFTWQASDLESTTLLYDLYLGKVWPPSLRATSLVNNSYTPDSLDYDTYYYWKVVVRDEDNAITEGSVWTFLTAERPNQAPYAPNSPSPANNATGIDEYTSLSWNCSDPDGDMLYYDIHFSASNPPAEIASNQTLETWTPPSRLNSNTTYFWKIIAKDAPTGGEQTPSSIWQFTTGQNQSPAAPGSPSPANASENVTLTPTLYWTCSDPEHDQLFFDVYFDDSNPPVTKVDSNLTANFYVPDELDYRSNYYWKVTVRDDYGNTRQGSVWRFRTRMEAPEAPTPLSPASGDLEDVPITFVWNSSEYSAQYQFQATGLADPGFANPLVNEILNDTTTTHGLSDGLNYNYGYYWRVRGSNESGYGAWSTSIDFRIRVGAPTLSQPLNNAVQVPVAPNTFFEWNEPSGGADHYHLQINTQSDFSTGTMVVDQDNINQTFYPATGLANNTRYYWRVYAVDANGANGAASQVWSFTTLP